MQSAEFNAFIEEKLNDIRDLLVRKGDEYVPAGAVEKSRFHNFEVSAALNGTTKEQALWGFVTKHIVSLADMVKGEVLDHDLAKWDEKIGDVSVYMLLLHAMVGDSYGKMDMVKEAMAAYRDHVGSLDHLVDDAPDHKGNDIPPASAGASFHKDAYGIVHAIDEAEQKEASVESPEQLSKLIDVALHTEPVNKHTSVEHIQPAGVRQFEANQETARQTRENRDSPDDIPKSTTIDIRGQHPVETQKLMADAAKEATRQHEEKSKRIEKVNVVSDPTGLLDSGKAQNIVVTDPAGLSDADKQHRAWMARVTPPQHS